MNQLTRIKDTLQKRLEFLEIMTHPQDEEKQRNLKEYGNGINYCLFVINEELKKCSREQPFILDGQRFTTCNID